MMVPDGRSTTLLSDLPSDIDQLISDKEVELVVVASPSPTHFELAMKCMKAKKHVVVDKPMCLHLEDCDKMIECSKQNGVFLTVFHNRRLDGDFLTVKHLIQSKMLGERVKWV